MGEPLSEHARWDDLEAFQIIYEGIQNHHTIERIGSLYGTKFGGTRTLYRRLERLEKALDVQLVYRQRWSRETRVTSHGEKLYQQVKHVIALKQKLERDFQSQRPSLCIATSENIAFHVVGKVLASMPTREQFAIDLRFREGNDWREAIEIVRKGDADVGLLNVPGWVVPVHDLRSEILSSAQLWPLLVYPTHPFARRRSRGKFQPVRFEELRGEDVTIHEMYQDTFQAGRVSRSLFVVPRLSSGLALIQQGIAIAPWCEALTRLSPPAGVVKIPMTTKLHCISVIVYARHFPFIPPEPIKSFLKLSKTIFREAVECAHAH